jgi:flagellar motility protein MotE (MotC chaperone)
MLHGGMMPVVALIEIVRSVPPRHAADLLRELPADRLNAVMDGIGPAEIARVLSAAPGDFRATLVESLTDVRLLDVLYAQSDAESGQLLASLPDGRLGDIVGFIPDTTLATLLSVLPESRQAKVLQALEPGRRGVALSRKYEQEVAEALARANLDVRPAVGEASGIVVAQGLGWLFAVAAGFGDDGTITVGEAEAAAYRLGANAALAVTDQRPADAVLAYCREAQAQGRAVAATMWTGRQHDGPLKRTVVSLFPPG